MTGWIVAVSILTVLVIFLTITVVKLARYVGNLEGALVEASSRAKITNLSDYVKGKG